MPHLFVDISAHGYGHLAQVAPVLNALEIGDLRLSIRSGLACEQLRARIQRPFAHIPRATDFGYVMKNALSIDLAASAEKYRHAHADWPQRVLEEKQFLEALAPDLVLSDVSYLPLAGAQAAGLACLAMSSLNWADLFLHYYGKEAWSAPIHAQMHAAYAGADAFLRLTPGMPMASLPNRIALGPIATGSRCSRNHAVAQLGLPPDRQWALVAFGGFDLRLPLERWPRCQGVHWLIPREWPLERDDVSRVDEKRLPFADLLPNVDVIITKPGYGTFAEAACNGVPVLYLRRDDWPEQESLIAWLHASNRALEVDAAALSGAELPALLHKLDAMPMPPRPPASGIAQACRLLEARLLRN